MNKETFRDAVLKAVVLIGIAAVLIVAAVIFVDKRKVLHAYQSVPLNGWERNDSVVFTLDSLPQSGHYRYWVELRTNDAFPYQKLWMVAETELEQPYALTRDTIECSMLTEHGDVLGKGFNKIQYTFPFCEKELIKGQRGKIRLYHIMRGKLLTGVSDVGVRVERD